MNLRWLQFSVTLVKVSLLPLITEYTDYTIRMNVDDSYSSHPTPGLSAVSVFLSLITLSFIETRQLMAAIKNVCARTFVFGTNGLMDRIAH